MMKNLVYSLFAAIAFLAGVPVQLFSQTFTMGNSNGDNQASINYSGFPSLTSWITNAQTFYEFFEIYGSGDYQKRKLYTNSGPNGTWLSNIPFQYVYPSGATINRSYIPVSYFVSRKGDPPPSYYNPVPSTVPSPLDSMIKTSTISVTQGSSQYTQVPAWPGFANSIYLDTSYHIQKGVATVFAISYKPVSNTTGKVHLFYNRKDSSASPSDFTFKTEHKPFYSSDKIRSDISYSVEPFANSLSYEFDNMEGRPSGSILRHFVSLTNKNGTDGSYYWFMVVMTQEGANNPGDFKPSHQNWSLISPYLINNAGTWELGGKPVADFTVITMRSGRPSDPNQLIAKAVCACGTDKTQVTFNYEFCNEGTAAASAASIEFKNIHRNLFSDFEYLSCSPPMRLTEGPQERLGTWTLDFAFPPNNKLVQLSKTKDQTESCAVVEFKVCANLEPDELLRRHPNLFSTMEGCTTFDNGDGGRGNETVCVLNTGVPPWGPHDKYNAYEIESCRRGCCGNNRWWHRWGRWLAGSAAALGTASFLIFKD